MAKAKKRQVAKGKLSDKARAIIARTKAAFAARDAYLKDYVDDEETAQCTTLVTKTTERRSKTKTPSTELGSSSPSVSDVTKKQPRARLKRSVRHVPVGERYPVMDKI